MFLRLCLSLALANLALPLGSAARAQSLFQASPMTNLATTIDFPAPAATRNAKPAASPPVVAAQLDSSGGFVLRHLPNNAQGLRLPGEIATSEWPVYLTEQQTKQHLRFQLGFLSAIANLPEVSSLIIQINDVTIGHVRVNAPYKVKVITLDVPDDLVQPGFNALRLVAEHRHRADCSLAATYELWTQIDATQTGFLIPASVNNVTSLTDLPALPPGERGAMPIHAILPRATNTQSIDRVIRVAEQVAIQGRFEQPLVDVSDAAADGDGVNLAVGVHEELITRPGLTGLAAPNGPRLALLPATPTARPTILVTGRTSDEVDQAIQTFAEGSESKGSQQGLRAARAFPGYHMDGGAHLKMRDLGLISQEFNGRLFRTVFNIVMPPDFYPANYDKVQINMAGAYAPGLAAGAQIVVSVNDKIAVGSPLGKSSGEVFKARSITFPVGVLNPGLNRITLEAQLPTLQDAACDALSSSADQKRFLFLDDTEIIIPQIARVALSPNLSITATGGFPYAAWRGASHLFIPKPDPETIASAATLIARMALSAGRSMNFQLTTAPPALSDGSTMAIGAASAFEPATLAASGLDPEAMSHIWQRPQHGPDDADQRVARSKYEALNAARIALQRNFPAECRMRIQRPKTALENPAPDTFAARPSILTVAAPQPGAKPDDLAAQWEKSLNGAGWWNVSLPKFDFPLLTQAYQWVGQLMWSGRQRIASQIGARSSPINDDASLLMAQKNNGRGGEGIWTIVIGATPAGLRDGVSCLVDPRVWSQLGGEIAALDSSEAKITRQEPLDPSFINTQPLSYSNVRLIAAGWFSINTWAYVAFVMGLAFALAIVTLVFVRGVGRTS